MSYSFGSGNKRNMIIVGILVALVVLGALFYLLKPKTGQTTGKTVLTNPTAIEGVMSKSSKFRLEHTFGEIAAVPGNQD